MEESPQAPAALRPTEPQPVPEPGIPPGPAAAPPRETGGPKGLEPTRYGDWERNGRCIDF